MWWSIDFIKLSSQTLPPLLRMPVVTALLRAVTGQLQVMHGVFAGYRQDRLRRASASGISGVLTQELNAKFDPTARRIAIMDNDIARRYMRYTNEMRKAMYVYYTDETSRAYIRYLDECVPAFTVSVPAELGGREDEIRELVDYYRIAGVKYDIKYQQNG